VLYVYQLLDFFQSSIFPPFFHSPNNHKTQLINTEKTIC